MTEAEQAPATTDWPQLAQSYHAHHFQCPQCIAAGLGYSQRCHVGQQLWTAYQEGAL